MVHAYVNYVPFPRTAQEPFFHTAVRYPAFLGPSQIGKTETGAGKLLFTAFKVPSDYLVLGPTYQNHVKMTTLEKYRRLIPLPMVVLTADNNMFHATDRLIRLRTERTAGCECRFKGRPRGE